MDEVPTGRRWGFVSEARDAGSLGDVTVVAVPWAVAAGANGRLVADTLDVIENDLGARVAKRSSEMCARVSGAERRSPIPCESLVQRDELDVHGDGICTNIYTLLT